MRFLTIPEDADVATVLTTRDGKPIESWPFASGFFTAMLLPRLPKDTADATDVLCSLASKFKAARAGDVVELTDHEHEELCKVLKQTDLGGELLMCVTHFFHAVTTAAKKRPELQAVAAE